MNTHGHTVEEWRKISRRNEKLYRQRHPEQVRAKERRLYFKHREKRLKTGAQYRLKNRAKVLADKKKWQADNWAHRQDYTKKYYAINSDKIKARSGVRYHSNPKKALDQQRNKKQTWTPERRAIALQVHRRWHAKHKERLRPYMAAKAHERRAKKLSVTVEKEKTEKWICEIRRRKLVTCYYCQKQLPGKDCHIDHVLALTKDGLHAIENLCTSCPPCNLSKGNRLIPQWFRNGQQVLSL